MEITLIQAGALLGKSERTIQRWIQAKKLPALRLKDGSYRVKVEDLERFQQQSDETMLARIEVLEQDVAELKRLVTALSVPRPTPPISKPQHLIPIVHPATIVSARSFAEKHGISRDRMANWIKRGEITATPEPHGDTIQQNLTLEQQAEAIAYWDATGVLYQPCTICPHIVG